MTAAHAAADAAFYATTGWERARAAALVAEALRGADDGELYLQSSQSESLTWDDGRLRNASYDASRGFGLRAVMGDAIGYAHSADVSEAALRRASQTARAAIVGGHSGAAAPLAAPAAAGPILYQPLNPLTLTPFADKVALLQEIDGYVRAADPRVRQATISLSGSWTVVEIVRPDGSAVADIRPLVRLNVSVVLEENGRMENGSAGCGGRTAYDPVIAPARWKALADEALRQAAVNLTSRPAPAGEMIVVLGAGWPGVLLHEAVGHGLEGDFNRKKTSAFSGLMGQRVAAPGVTVVDDGTLADRRGSLTVDDEGSPTGRTVLIEDGILTGYLQDRMNARLMGVRPTGNGRRESYAHAPMPRMTNTFMTNGAHTPEEILASVKNGLYAVQFGGGQVDITSGKFVFSATEAYLIEDGKIGPAVKGATLIGNGPDSLKHISMIGNDSRLDDGIGTCGKDGQSVPVGVGQPTLRLDGLTVGGSA